MWLLCLHNDLGALPEKCVIKQHSHDIINKASRSAADAVLRYKCIICLEAESTKASEQQSAASQIPGNFRKIEIFV